MGAQAMLLGYGAASGGGGGAWNPADKSASIDLSGSDKIATRNATSNSTWQLVRSIASNSAGKKYFEIANTTDVSVAMLGGLAPSSLGLATYPGSSADSYGFHANASGSETYNNGAGANSGGTVVAQGSYMRVAVDMDAGKVWLGPAASWEGGGDPGAGTTPTYTFTPPLTLFAALGLYSSGQVCTLRAIAADIVGTIPTGFSAWE